MNGNNYNIKFEQGPQEDEFQSLDVRDFLPEMTPSQEDVLYSASLPNMDPSLFPNLGVVEDPTLPVSFVLTGTEYGTQVTGLVLPTSSETPAPAAHTPSLSSYPGPYCFNANFSKAEDSTKATPWIYSERLNKLYAGLDKAFPVSFAFDGLNEGASQYFQIRAQVFLTRQEDFNEPVHCCSTHEKLYDSSLTSAISKHFLRCDDSSAQYLEDEKGRHSVIARLGQPAFGEKHVTLRYRFMCRSSCMGGVNRRPTTLVFTLETFEGDIVGRYCVPVRVCSCPGRDIKTEEEKWEKSNGKQPGSRPLQNLHPRTEDQQESQQRGKKRKLPKEPAPGAEAWSHSVPPSVLAADDDDKIYHLPVRGRKMYEFMKSQLKTLEYLESSKTMQQNPVN